MRLKESIVILKDDLIKKSKEVKIYTNIQIYGSVMVMAGFIGYYYFYIGEKNLNRIMNKYEFFFLVLIVAIFNIALEKSGNVLKKEETSLKNKLKDKMILKVCKCNGYCECKEELNEFMKKKGVKVI